jgi:methylthioribose-1-phosphate isomerase
MQKPIEWRGDRLILLDQRQLPSAEVYLECVDWQQVADAIRDMVVRGAPAIGITAAYGFYLGVKSAGGGCDVATLNQIRQGLMATRPTAVNLGWALDRMYGCATTNARTPQRLTVLEQLACDIETQDRDMCSRMGRHGAAYLGNLSRVLTHCNTGTLATGGDGTALAVIREMHRRSPLTKIFVDETRPYLQGSRLTAWELQREGLPACLITDSMAGYMMQNGDVDAVVVGADRIAANGDVANKIGTYTLAVLCRHHQIPFLVVAPTSTFDATCATGADIEIEYRPVDELKFVGAYQIAPADVDALNPSFDVTPNILISAIVTEVGVVETGQAHLLLKHQEMTGSNIAD